MKERSLKDICIQIGGMVLKCHTDEELLSFDDFAILKYKVDQPEKNYTTINYTLEYTEENEDSDFKLVFEGGILSSCDLTYSWKIFKNNDVFKIIADFLDVHPVKSISAVLRKKYPIIDIFITPWKKENLSIDPLIHPIGSFILMYQHLWYGGILIHGSAINYQNNTFLFTGVSGIGKSTMAGLWESFGAEVINDDRLILKKLEEKIIVYNNPMPFYQQEPKQGNLSGIFLLKQEKYNYIKKLKGVHAFSRVLANCIQQFYDPEMIKKHLDLLDNVVQSVPVYELGFLPTTEIVKDILKYTGDEG